MQEEGVFSEHALGEPSEKLVLLVDDDESLLDLMEHIVKREGFKTERAMDGNEAIRKVEASSPDLILLDLMLPGKGGYEVIRELQASEAARIPIIVITGRYIDRKNVDMVRGEPNVRDFIQKPLRPTMLASTIHTILQTRPPEINRSTKGPWSGPSL
ncbi:MAG: response regulator [Elusimicrobia bacterium]|nr:response regulator [Elusimicrobiota bacterium]